MTTKREQIMARLLTTLANTTGVSTRIYRSRVVPLSRGGNNNLANTQALCNACWENKNSIDKFLQ